MLLSSIKSIDYEVIRISLRGQKHHEKPRFQTWYQVSTLLLMTFMFLAQSPTATAEEIYFTSPGYLLEPQILVQESLPSQSDPITSDSAVDQSRAVVVERLQRLSKQIDSFFLNRFFGEQVINDDDFSGSRAKLAITTEHRPGQLIDFRVRFKLRIVLPNTNERLSLLFEANDEDEIGIENSTASEGDGVNAAVRFIVREKDRWRTNIDAGVRSGLPPKVFIRARSTRSWFIDDWSLRFRQGIAYFSHEGPSSTTEFRSDYLFNRYRFIRFETQAKYFFDDQLFESNHRLRLFQELDAKNAIAYGLQALGDTSRDNDIYQYQLEFRWRRQVWRSWLFLEVAPALEWAEDNDFNVTPLITFKVEALFDKY